MRAKVNENIGAITGTAAIYRFVTPHGDCILKMSAERVHYVMFFETETARDRVVWMEDTVATETVGLPTGTRDIDVFTVLTGDFGVTEDTRISYFFVYTDG